MGADFVGTAVTGVAIAYLQPEPEAAAALAAAGSVLPHMLRAMGSEIMARYSGPREKRRIGATYAFAIAKIQESLESGHRLRQDGFFQEQPGERAAAEEILEGVLLAAQREHEEKKLRFLGNILGNVAFMPEVSAAQANWLLQKAQELTYRQMCIIALTERKSHKNPSYGPSDGDPAFAMEYKPLLDLWSYKETTEDFYRGHRNKMGDLSRIVGLNRMGKLCYTVMGLEEIPEDDLRKLAPRFPGAFERDG
jgi:hypothetical protein